MEGIIKTVNKNVPFLLYACLVLMYLSCSGGKTKSTTNNPSKKVDSLGIYVYIDGAGVLHTKNGCGAVFKDHSMQVVRPVETIEVSEYNLRRICSQCVTEDNLLYLKDIVKAKEIVSEYEADTLAADYNPDTNDPDNDEEY